MQLYFSNGFTNIVRQLSLACRRNTYLWLHPRNNSPTVSNRSSGQTTSARRLIMQSLKTGRKTSSVASAVRHVEPSCRNQMLPIFSSSSIFVKKKFFQHRPITIAIDCNGFSLLIFEEKWPSYASGPKSAPNSDSFWVLRLFNVCMRVFCAPNASIVLVYITANIKLSFLWKDNYIFCQNQNFL